MSYCLGLHVEDNYIKYAKVLNRKDQLPVVELFGVKFYDNLQMTISQIIEETYSYGAEIAINLTNEFYDYFDEEFAGMSEAVFAKHLKLMFQEEICSKKNINSNSIESRYLASKKKEGEDVVQVIYMSAPKTDISARSQLVKGKIKKVLPISIANVSLMNMDSKSNFAILNIDSTTTLTVVVKGEIKKVFNINIGMGNILSKLNQKYSSYSKAYSQCKNITLFSDSTKDLYAGEVQEDLNDIAPYVYDITERTKSFLGEYVGIINNLYITGLGAAINNIDLYLEDELDSMNVEILKTKNISMTEELNKKIKDLVEVNSAIALAICPEKIGGQNINFLKSNPLNEVLSEVKANEYFGKIADQLEKSKAKVKTPKEKPVKVKSVKVKKPSETLNKVTKVTSKVLLALLVLLIGYIATTLCIANKYDANEKKINEASVEINDKIAKIREDMLAIKTDEEKLKNVNEELTAVLAEMDRINGITEDVPGLLTLLALEVPDEVKMTKMEIDGSNVRIEVESAGYSDVGFFISSLKNNRVLSDIKIDTISDENGLKIAINGVML